VWDRYETGLSDWASHLGVTSSTVVPGRQHSAHLFFVLMADHFEQRAMLAHLADHGILGTFHYVPLDSSPFGTTAGRTGPTGCPTTASISDRLIRLPLYPDLSERATARVIDAVTSFARTAAP
jgi:dTDP-4-amino-4,6-dideoxygalactose transaminase